eukprot:XP_001708844.1 Hypothetical protein GL50803_32434 [Giardia lamblia ATCC 50803]
MLVTHRAIRISLFARRERATIGIISFEWNSFRARKLVPICILWLLRSCNLYLASATIKCDIPHKGKLCGIRAVKRDEKETLFGVDHVCNSAELLEVVLYFRFGYVCGDSTHIYFTRIVCHF